MICSKCGTKNPDGSAFCAGCGSSMIENEVTQPINQTAPRTSQPIAQMPPQFAAQPTAYPVAERAPHDPKKKKMIIIISACAAVVAAFLIVLFAAIIPANSPKGKLKHIWSCSDSYGTRVMDLKNNTLTTNGRIQPITWQVQGQLLTVTNVSTVGINIYTYTILNGKTLYIWEGTVMDNTPDYTYIRTD